MGYTKGIRWSDELIIEKILEVKNALQIDRMPSRSECRQYFQDDALVNAVSKRCGWYELARKLELPIKESETHFGKSYEAIAAEILQGFGFQVRKMSQNFPYDLLVEECVKVDVKASHLYKGKNGCFFSFGLDKNFATCDFYLLLLINDDETIKRKLVVPSNCVIANNQISVGVERSKYHKFTDRFDLIEQMVAFWNGLVVGI